MMSLGAGAVISKSTKQRINGKSSTDNEIIAVNDFMGPVLNTMYFMEAQGHNVKQNIMFQDNQSNMKFMINGKKLSTKRSKHISVKYFFMHDVIKHGDMSLGYCSTGDMWADVLTKPVQGEAFKKMRSKLMNMPEVYVKDDHPIVKVPSSAPKSTGVIFLLKDRSDQE